MNDFSNFKLGLLEEKKYSTRMTSNTVSKVKRANAFLKWFNDPVYLFNLEQIHEYQELSVSVRSQIKKAVKLFTEYVNFQENETKKGNQCGMKVLSLFANIGVAEAYLRQHLANKEEKASISQSREIDAFSLPLAQRKPIFLV